MENEFPTGESFLQVSQFCPQWKEFNRGIQGNRHIQSKEYILNAYLQWDMQQHGLRRNICLVWKCLSLTQEHLGVEGSITCMYIWGWWLDRGKELYQRNEPSFIFRGVQIHCPHLQHIFEFSQQKIKKNSKLHFKEICSQFQIRAF